MRENRAEILQFTICTTFHGSMHYRLQELFGENRMPKTGEVYKSWTEISAGDGAK